MCFSLWFFTVLWDITTAVKSHAAGAVPVMVVCAAFLDRLLGYGVTDCKEDLMQVLGQFVSWCSY